MSDYNLGSDNWPGLSKLAEEAGELLQVIGKLMGTGGAVNHWDGSDLSARFVEEAGDVLAALEVVLFLNSAKLDLIAVEQRKLHKRRLFMQWHTQEEPLPPVCPGPECTLCTGEHCAEHGSSPCECDSLQRHGID